MRQVLQSVHVLFDTSWWLWLIDIQAYQFQTKLKFCKKLTVTEAYTMYACAVLVAVDVYVELACSKYGYNEEQVIAEQIIVIILSILQSWQF